MDNGDWVFPTDVFVEILLRLPTLSQRRFRLVCRRWRAVIDSRTTALRCRAKPLLWDINSCSASIIDDLSSPGKPRKLWSGGRTDTSLRMVGTSNGLICLCDDRGNPGGALTLVNPATGEELHVPPVLSPNHLVGTFRNTSAKWHKAYSFTYHQATGQYKIVHVSCRFDNVYEYEFENLQVFTLGQASWRDVPVPYGTRCNLDTGIACVGDTVYWVAQANGKIISFDLNDECIKPVVPLPITAGSKHGLTRVHGRLAMATKNTNGRHTEVWVLEHGWRRRYNIERSRLAWPHFIQGEYVLAANSVVSTQKPKNIVWITYEVWITYANHKTVIADTKVSQAFAYIETKEPLNTYMSSP